MKKLQFLKALLHLTYILSIFGIVTMVILIPFMFFSEDPLDVPVIINNETILALDLTAKILLTLTFIAYCFFVYGI